MSKQYTGFKAYGTDGKLRLVGGGVAPAIGKNPGIRWEIGKVETFTFPTAIAVLLWTERESAGIAQWTER